MELTSSMRRQGITEPAYLAATGKTVEELLADMRPDAERRVKTLLVLSRVADAEGVEVPPERIEAEVEEARGRYASNPRLAEYVGSERARASLRSSLRRSIVVEKIIDGWLAAHPDHPAIPHIEDATPDAAHAAVGDEPAVEA
jgi:trigger factor